MQGNNNLTQQSQLVLPLPPAAMLLKTSFSNTKKFFQRTLQSFKSFLSGGYQRLPKTPPFNPFSCGGGGSHFNVHPSYGELDKLYTDFTDQWDSGKGKARKRSKKKTATASPAIKTQEKDIYSGSFMKFAKVKTVNNNEMERRVHDTKRRSVHEGKRGEEHSSCPGMEEERSYLVAQKLRELEMMDVGNVDHVLDIEEVLHYYSRLTCPPYLDMVDKFFMNIFSEFFSPTASAGSPSKSRAALISSMKL